MVNGHEDVACQAKKEGLAFTKESNCFTEITDTVRLAKIADTLCSPNMIGRLSQVGDRWIYSACLGLALDLAEQEQSGFQYEYSVFQTEYSRNLLFMRGGELEQIVQGVIDRTRRVLEVKTLKTILGVKKRPTRRQGYQAPRCEIVVERPTYDPTVFRLQFGKLTVKLYTKGEHVLRIEVVVHTTHELRCGRALAKFSVIIARRPGLVNRFLNVLRGVDVVSISDAQWETLPLASQVGQTRVGGVDLNKPRMRAVIEAVIALAPAPAGFSSSDLASKVPAASHTIYTPRQAAYDLKKLRGKQVVGKIGTSRRYETVPEGLQAVAALLVLRDKVIKPVLAGAGKPRRGPKPKQQSAIDAHYETIQAEMRNLFQTIGIAA